MSHDGEAATLAPPDYPEDDGHPSLAWLREQWELGNTKKLEEMVELWRTFELLGKIGRWIRKVILVLGKVLVWFAGLVGAWWVVVEGISRLQGGGK